MTGSREDLLLANSMFMLFANALPGLEQHLADTHAFRISIQSFYREDQNLSVRSGARLAPTILSSNFPDVLASYIGLRT